MTPQPQIILEAFLENVEEACSAHHQGGQRIEFCSNLEVGRPHFLTQNDSPLFGNYDLTHEGFDPAQSWEFCEQRGGIPEHGKENRFL